MTDLLVRPTAPGSSAKAAGHSATDSSSRPRWPLVSGVLAAVVAAALGLAVVELLVTVLALGDGRSDATLSEALHVGAALWLLAHGATLHFPEGLVTLVPLGLTAFVTLLLHRAGRFVALRVPSRGRRGIPAAAAAVAVPYALLLLLIVLSLGTGAGPARSSFRGALGGLVLALGAAGWGAAGVLAPDRLAFLRRGGRVLRLSGPAPSVARVVLRSALVACAVLFAGAALLAAVCIAAKLTAAAELAQDTTGGALSGTGVLVVQLALLPNLLVWFVCYATGPGFSVGAETSVQLVDGRLGEVPALPMFGGLPGSLPAPLIVAVVLIPVLAGVLSGRIVAGRLAAARLRVLALAALAVGPVAGALVAVAVALASGQVLGGGLADVGGSVWQTGLAVALEVGLLTALTALTVRRWRVHRAARRRAVVIEPDGGAHRRGDRQPGSRRVRRPTWLRTPTWLRPSWLRRPDRLRLPSGLRRPSRLRPWFRLAGKLKRPSWSRRRRKAVQLPD